MARAVFKLFGMIGMKGLEKVDKDLKAVDKQAKQLARSLTKTGRNISKMGANLSGKLTAPIVALAGGLTLLAVKTGAYADKMLDLEEITGLSVKNLQKMEFIAAEAGVSFEGFVGVISKFQSRLPGIIEGTGRAAETMAALGVNVNDSQGNLKDMNDLFPEMIKALQGVDDITARNAMAMQLFGRSMADLAPILGMTADDFDRIGNEAADMGVIMDRDALLAANDFRVSLEKLQAQFTSVFRVISTKFMPILNDTIIPLIKDTVIPLLLDFGDAIGEVLNWFNSLSPEVKKTAVIILGIVAALGPALLIFGKIVMVMKTLIPVLILAKKAMILLSAAMAANPIGAVIVLVVALVAAIVWLFNNNETFRRRFLEIWDDITHHVQQAVSVLKVSFFLILNAALAMVAGIANIFPGLAAKVEQARKAVKDMEREERLAIITRSRLRKETLLQRKANDLLRESIEGAKKSVDKLVKSETKAKTLSAAQLQAIAARRKAMADAAKAAAEDRSKFEDQWTRKLEESTATRKELLELEYQDALAQADKLGADRDDIELFYAGERARITEDAERKKLEMTQKAASKLVDERARFEEQWTRRLSGSILNRKQLLELEYQSALDIADKLGADRNDIELFYAIERLKIAEDEEMQKRALDEETAQLRKDAADFARDQTINSISDMFSVISQFYDMRMDRIKATKQADIAAVNESVMSQEEKAEAIGVIEEESAKKIRELKRKQAISDKAHAIFGIVIATAQAIMTAFAQLGPIGGAIAGAIIGGIGIAQIAVVAARPVPLARGGLVRRTPGGVNTVIGEGQEDEIVLPLETGVMQLADALQSKFRDVGASGIGIPDGDVFGGRAVENHWHIGTLVANDDGIKQLEQRLRPFKNREDQRQGALS